MKKYLLMDFIILLLLFNSLPSIAQAIEGKDICTVKIKLSENQAEEKFKYGIYANASAGYDSLNGENVRFIKTYLVFSDNNTEGRKMEYVSADDNTVIASTKKRIDDRYQVIIKFGTYGLSHKGEIRTDIPFLAKPYLADSIKSITNVFTDLLTYNLYFINNLNFKDPYLLIAKEKEFKRKKWVGSDSGEAYAYYFILWDKSTKLPDPDILKSPNIESYELIKINVPEISDVTQELIYVDISQIKNRKGLYKELKRNCEILNYEGIKYNLLISNGNEPYMGSSGDHKQTLKALKHIRLTETELPSRDQDLRYLKELIKKKDIFGTHGKVRMRFYLSDLFYQVNAAKTKDSGKTSIEFINQLINSENCSDFKISIHLENANNEFEEKEYDCEL